MTNTISLANKYRPVLFKDLVGQEQNQKFFKALIANGQISRNVVLSGAYGSSKTSSARIYARALLCEHPTPDGEPCNSCSNCIQSLNGTHPDIMEIDASSKGGKEDIINLLELAKTPPMFGKRRIIIDDEVQAHSRQAWDALLKLIEEPPSFLTFIFCTTEKEKVRPAILSRCAVRDVNLISNNAAKNHLINICNKENFRYDDKALEIIVQASQGHPRNLLKNLEQISFLGDISEDNARNLLVDSNIESIFEFVKMLHTPCNFKAIIDYVMNTQLSASEIYNYVKLILSHINYNVFQKMNVTLDVMITLCPQNKVNEVAKLITERAQYKSMNVSDYISDLLEYMMNKNTPSMKIDLLNVLSLIYSYISSSMNNIFSKSQPTNIQATVNSSSNSSRRRRIINPNFIENNETVSNVTNIVPSANIQPVVSGSIMASIPDDIDPEMLDDNYIPEQGSQIYCHTLTGQGFGVTDLNKVGITEFNG